MPAAQLSAAQLHELILPLARPPQVVLTPGQTIDEALRAIRTAASASSIHYFYVVDDDARLVGVVPTRRLLAAAPEDTVGEVMVENVVAIPDWATVLIASEYFATRRLLAFPVVDGSGVLLGVVDVNLFTDEVIDLARRTYDDIFQLIGVHGTAQRSTLDAFKDRFPWLSCNIAGGLMAAFIASRFEHLLQEVVVLALFIPAVGSSPPSSWCGAAKPWWPASFLRRSPCRWSWPACWAWRSRRCCGSQRPIRGSRLVRWCSRRLTSRRCSSISGSALVFSAEAGPGPHASNRRRRSRATPRVRACLAPSRRRRRAAAG